MADESPQSKPAPVPLGGTGATVIHVIKELGLTTALVAFVCYLLAVQLPAMQADFRAQTSELISAVNESNSKMGELANELREFRRDVHSVRRP